MNLRFRSKTACMLLLYLLMYLGAQGWSDSLLVSVHYTNRPLTEVLAGLADKYRIRFAYEPATIAGVRVSVHIENRPLEEAIALILGSSGLDFRIMEGRQVMIRPRRESDAPGGEQPPPPLHFEGYVRDLDTGLPLPYANISVHNTRWGVIGNKDGHFSFRIPHTDEPISLKITYIGYETRLIELEPGQSSLLIGLKAKNSTLETVEIQEKQPLLLGSGSGISQLSLSAGRLGTLPSLGSQDVFHALKYLPGVNALDEASMGLSIRGGSSEENLVLLDDINLYHIDHFWGIFSTFNPSAISQVDVYKSAFPLKYGGRTSSVIALQGRRGDSLRAHVEAGMDLLSGQLKLEVPLGRKFSLLLAGRRAYTDVVQSKLYQDLFAFASQQEENDIGIPLRQPPRDTLPHLVNTQDERRPRYHFYDLHAKASFQPRKGEYLDLNFFQGYDELDFSVNRTFVYFRAGLRQRIAEQTVNLTDWRNQGGSLRWHKEWNAAFTSHFSASYSQFEKNYRLTTDIERTTRHVTEKRRRIDMFERNYIRDFSLRAELQWQPGQQHLLQGGLFYQHNDLTYFLRINRRVIQQREPQGAMPAVYLEHTFSPAPFLSLNWGLRNHYSSLLKKTYLSPRISLKIKPVPRLELKAAWGRYHQFTRKVYLLSHLANLNAFWGLADGRHIPLSQATHSVLGFSLNYPHFQLDVEAYHKSLSGLLTYSTLHFAPEAVRDTERPLPDYRFFEGSGNAWGLDVLLRKSTGKYTAWLAYSLGRVMHQYEELNRGQPFPAEEDQRHQLKWVNMLRLGQVDLSLTYVWGSGKAFTDLSLLVTDSGDLISPRDVAISSQRLPDYHRVDVGATWHLPLGLNSRAELGASVYNLLNRENIKYRQYLYTLVQSTDAQANGHTSIVGDDALMLGFTPNLFLKLRF